MKRQKEYREIKKVEEKLDDIEKKMEKSIDHFSKRDLINAFFGSLLVGLTFLFKGVFFNVTVNMSWFNIYILILVNLAILVAEIYYIGYQRVKNKSERPFFQFMIKRLVAFYGISIACSAFMLIIFDIRFFVVSSENMLKLIYVLSFPASLGASIADLLKKYD
jgi:uncharacterized membrane protein